MKYIVFTRQDNIEVRFQSSLKDVENLNENFLLTTRETTTYLEANLFYHFDSKPWTLNELLFFAENNLMIVSIYDENDVLLKEYNYNIMRTKKVPGVIFQ